MIIAKCRSPPSDSQTQTDHGEVDTGLGQPPRSPSEKFWVFPHSGVHSLRRTNSWRCRISQAMTGRKPTLQPLCSPDSRWFSHFADCSWGDARILTLLSPIPPKPTLWPNDSSALKIRTLVFRVAVSAKPNPSCRKQVSHDYYPSQPTKYRQTWGGRCLNLGGMILAGISP
ncbi:uncharacterized protein BO95DRAFT_70428 [Aspergillus brunneoviolaceus CBS 621.78]|uniref:Uncharacterized protein n=1 Tax=Aspergillus brunneoviolaceus CBS 621.78 TaxID=1450534 RepID=A0ACD1GEU4_9EURO|nr:hypothetical protein BO95DRAFT_70428 [Aspergillus brunneoviolaceus CBS 621.78]RAH47835.1 hypothetical protein BO95DRAFT_70428 [Aspergillus brunneoviolaceus CBS 621.78]